MSEPIELARELGAHLRGRAAAAEPSGCCAPETHELLRERGFYAALLPARDGGLGLDLGEFIAVVSELARGCPASAWCAASLAVGSARARVLFDVDGALRATSAAATDAIATRSDGGWVVSGTFARAAGARFATHVLGVALVEGQSGVLRFLAARGQFELRDAGAGERACVGGIELAQAPIRESFAAAVKAPVDDWTASVPPATLAAVFAGAAARAAEIHEQIVRAAPRSRALDADHQRWLGATIARAAAARLLLREAAAANAGGVRLGSLARQAMRYAWDGVQGALRVGGAAERDGREELERIARFMLNGLSDPAALPEEWIARQLARERLELPLDAAPAVP